MTFLWKWKTLRLWPNRELDLTHHYYSRVRRPWLWSNCNQFNLITFLSVQKIETSSPRPGTWGWFELRERDQKAKVQIRVLKSSRRQRLQRLKQLLCYPTKALQTQLQSTNWISSIKSTWIGSRPPRSLGNTSQRVTALLIQITVTESELPILAILLKHWKNLSMRWSIYKMTRYSDFKKAPISSWRTLMTVKNALTRFRMEKTFTILSTTRVVFIPWVDSTKHSSCSRARTLTEMIWISVKVKWVKNGDHIHNQLFSQSEV